MDRESCILNVRCSWQHVTSCKRTPQTYVCPVSILQGLVAVQLGGADMGPLKVIVTCQAEDS